MGIEQSISRIINQGENLLAGGGSPQPGFMATPNMLSVAERNPSLDGGQLAGSTVAGVMPRAPNTNRLAQMANPTAGGIGSQFGVPIGAALGFLQGGPKGALQGGMTAGMDTAFAASGNPGLSALTPQAMQMLGMGSQQQSQPSSPSAMTQQRPMPAPQQMQPNVMPQPLPAIAGRQHSQLPPQVAQMLGLG